MSDAYVRNAYDSRAAEYIELFGDVGQMSRLDRDLNGRWRDSTSGPLLDAGCGPGHWTNFLHDGHRDILGIDLSEEFLATRRAVDRVACVSTADLKSRWWSGLGLVRDGMLGLMEYVRFEAAAKNSRGIRPGIFGLANGLAHSGVLSPEDWALWRASNDWCDAAYLNPADIDSSLFDRSRNPQVTCWFKATARHLLDRVPGYLDLLDRYGVSWMELRSQNPGQILYEDDVQVVVVPSPNAESRPDVGLELLIADRPAFAAARFDQPPIRRPSRPDKESSYVTFPGGAGRGCLRRCGRGPLQGP